MQCRQSAPEQSASRRTRPALAGSNGTPAPPESFPPHQSWRGPQPPSTSSLRFRALPGALGLTQHYYHSGALHHSGRRDSCIFLANTTPLLTRPHQRKTGMPVMMRNIFVAQGQSASTILFKYSSLFLLNLSVILHPSSPSSTFLQSAPIPSKSSPLSSSAPAGPAPPLIHKCTSTWCSLNSRATSNRSSQCSQPNSPRRESPGHCSR